MTLEFIKTPDKWPHWPWLPVVRNDRAAIVAITSEGYTIARGANMFGTLKDLAFESVTPEQIVEEGWRVD